MNGDPVFTWKNTGKRFKIGLNETFNSLPTDTSIDDFENNVRHSNNLSGSDLHLWLLDKKSNFLFLIYLQTDKQHNWSKFVIF